MFVNKINRNTQKKMLGIFTYGDTYRVSQSDDKNGNLFKFLWEVNYHSSLLPKYHQCIDHLLE